MTDVYCSHCDEVLLRFANSETDIVVCPVCRRNGDSKEVLENSAGITDRPISDELWATIQHHWHANKLSA